MPAKVLLLRPDRNGDAIKTLPALRALKALRPDLDLHLLSSPHNYSLFDAEPGIKLHRLDDKWTENPKDWGKLAGIWDVVVSLPCDSFPENEELLLGISSSRKFSVGMGNLRFTGNSPKGKDERGNIAAIIAQTLEPRVETEWQKMEGAPKLMPSDIEEAEKALGKKSGKWLAVCPLASLSRRSAPIATWQKFCDKIFQSGTFDRFFLVTDPAGRETAKQWAGAGNVQLVEASSFRALGAYLKMMDGVAAVDSGPLHYARSLGLPTFGVGSGGDARRWHLPQTPKSLLLSRGLFTSHPTFPEIWLGYRRWTSKLF